MKLRTAAAVLAAAGAAVGVIDLYAARQQTRRDEISDEWIVTHMQQLLVACTGTEPVIV